MLRYWTGDLCSLTHEPDRDGRTHARMSAIVGRADDMLIIRGVNVYPSQLEDALLEVPGVTPHFQLVVSRTRTLDEMEVRVEGDGVDAAVVAAKLKSSLGLSVSVTIEAAGTVPRSDGGKLNRVLDLR